MEIGLRLLNKTQGEEGFLKKDWAGQCEMLSWTMNNCLHLKRSAVSAVLAGSSLSDSIISLQSPQCHGSVRSPRSHRAQLCPLPHHQNLCSAHPWDQGHDTKPTMVAG